MGICGSRRNRISRLQFRVNSAKILQNSRLQAGKKLVKIARRKAARKRLVRFGLVAANAALLLGVVGVVTLGHNEKSEPSAVSLKQDTTQQLNPVDRLTSYDVAANVARTISLEETNALNNQAQSARVESAVSSSDTNIAPKPQVVTTALKSWRDIQDYKVVEGDTVQTVAQKFGVTSESIRWSNSLNADSLAVGTTIVIPPVNGIVYTVKAGDTPASLAAKYNANADQITQYNDAEKGFVLGRRIIIPDGKIVVASAPARSSSYNSAGVTPGGFTPRYGGNGYDYGWCTWYAAARSGAPGNWGNANTWAYYAARSGWTVSSAPRAGAIFQTPSGWAGHVGMVDEVYDNGTMKISDMNGIAGFGRVGSKIVPIGTYPNYIFR